MFLDYQQERKRCSVSSSSVHCLSFALHHLLVICHLVIVKVLLLFCLHFSKASEFSSIRVMSSRQWCWWIHQRRPLLQRWVTLRQHNCSVMETVMFFSYLTAYTWINKWRVVVAPAVHHLAPVGSPGLSWWLKGKCLVNLSWRCLVWDKASSFIHTHTYIHTQFLN